MDLASEKLQDASPQGAIQVSNYQRDHCRSHYSAHMQALDELIDPPYSGTERETLTTMLDYYRVVLFRKAAGLTDEQLGQRLGPSTLTIGSLLYHSALVEDHWFRSIWLADNSIEPWSSADWEADPDWEMTRAGALSGEEIRNQYQESVARSQVVLAEAADLSQISQGKSKAGNSFSMRFILVHLIEEYARHCGHADLIRESIDGVTGD